MRKALEFFNGRAMPTKVEAENRVFPESNSAQSVWNVLVEYLKNGKVEVRTNATVAGFDMESKKILIVEDDQFLREFYQELLQGEGYLVDVAADGEIGLAKIKEDGYHLVLLDIMLPKKDGLQILRELKLGETGKKINIVIPSPTHKQHVLPHLQID